MKRKLQPGDERAVAGDVHWAAWYLGISVSYLYKNLDRVPHHVVNPTAIGTVNKDYRIVA